MTSSPAIPAATLVIVRETASGMPEFLMVERAKAMAFASGAMVFPGGRVDPGDHALAASNDRPDEEGANEEGADEEGAARVAAIRETLEEVGLAIGIVPVPPAAVTDRLRTGLHGGRPFADLLAAEGLALDLSVLVPFARWRPSQQMSRVFDARFYLARAPAGADAAVVDGTENSRLIWATAAAILGAAAAGRMTVIYPTRRNLERLAQFASFAAAVADAAAHPVTMIVPTTEWRDGVEHICIPTGLGYPMTAEPLAQGSRG